MRILYYSQIYNYLERFVVGQEEAKKSLAVAGYLFSISSLALEGGVRRESLPSLSMLLAGPTGCGKTYLVEKLADYMSVPLLKVDCSVLTSAGWSGQDTFDFLTPFFKEHPDGPTIVLLDEIDKLCEMVASTGGGIPNLQTQSNIMPLLEGKVNQGCKYTTEGIKKSLIIACGAFSNSPLVPSSSPIGFGRDVGADVEDLRDLLTKAGLMPELVGRFTRVVKLNELTDKEIAEIITKQGSVLEKYQNLQIGVSLTDDTVKRLTEEIKNTKYGLRILNELMFKLVAENIVSPYDYLLEHYKTDGTLQK